MSSNGDLPLRFQKKKTPAVRDRWRLRKYTKAYAYPYFLRIFTKKKADTAMARSSAATMEHHTPSISQKMGRIKTAMI